MGSRPLFVMNHFPKFDPNDAAHVQLTSIRLNQVSLGQKSNQIQPGVGYRVSQTPGGTTVSVIKRRGGGGSAGICPFGELITNAEDPPITSIRGGLMVCGDQNFNVADYPIDLETPGRWLVEISLSDIELGTDDDGEIFVGNVITSTSTPAWNLIPYTGSENYTDTTNPVDPATPTGTIIIGLGVLTIEDGAATFVATGCGTIRVGACEGILSHTRGG